MLYMIGAGHVAASTPTCRVRRGYEQGITTLTWGRARRRRHHHAQRRGPRTRAPAGLHQPGVSRSSSSSEGGTLPSACCCLKHWRGCNECIGGGGGQQPRGRRCENSRYHHSHPLSLWSPCALFPGDCNSMFPPIERQSHRFGNPTSRLSRFSRSSKNKKHSLST